MEQIISYPRRFVEKARRNHWSIGMSGFVGLTIGSFVVGGLFGWMIAGMVTGALLGCFMAYMVPLEWLERIEKRNTEHQRVVLVDAIRSIQNAYTATGSLVAAMETSLPMMRQPAADAFQQVLVAARTGKSLSEAMAPLKKEFLLRELDFFIRSSDVIEKAGGRHALVLMERSVQLIEDAKSREEAFDAEMAVRYTESRHLFGLFLFEAAAFRLFEAMNPDIQIGGPFLDVLIALLLATNICAWFVFKRQVIQAKRKLI